MRLPRPAGLPKKIPAKWWRWLKLPGRFPVEKPANFWVWKKWRQSKKQPIVNPIKPIQMFDDVNVSLIPVDSVAVAGYVDGRWPTYATLVKKFPHAQHYLSIAVFAKDDADALDVEPGDATIAEAAAWVKRQRKNGNPRPVVYTAISWGQNLVDALTKAGLEYGKDYLYWSAHYTGKPHLCSSKCGFGFKGIAHATQWTDMVNGKNLDESLCSAAFFPKQTQV